MVSTDLQGGTGLYTSGSANQAIRNLVINGISLSAGAAVNGIEAWGAVWDVKLDDVSVMHMPQYGISTDKASSGTSDTTGKTPDGWHMFNVHAVAGHDHGIFMTGISDSYFVACASTGNSGPGTTDGWHLSGDNIKMVGCKAEYNQNVGLYMSKSTSGRPNLISAFGTDGNYRGGIQLVTTGSGAGPWILDGIGLNYDGWNGNAGTNYPALYVSGPAHVSVSGLHVTTSNIQSTAVCPAWAIQTSATFTGVLQMDQCDLYGGVSALNLSTASGATGIVRFGPNVLTGSGNWNANTTANVVRAPSPQTDPQQYAKYWSPTAGTSGNWVTSTTQQPRESIPWYAAVQSPTSSSGQMLCAVIPVQPGDVISKLGFVIGGTAPTMGTGPNWWTALYTISGTTGTLKTQATPQTGALLANVAHLLDLGTPYTVPAGMYAVLGAVMVNTGTGGSATITFRGVSTNAVLMGGANDLFPGSTIYAATSGSGLTTTAPSPTATLTAATNLLYLGAC